MARLLASSNRDLVMANSDPDEGAGFHQNERLLHSEFSAPFRRLSPKLYGIYGSEDGLFSAKQVATISSLLSPSHFTLIERAGHLVFIDQEERFLDALSKNLEALSTR
jgi:proline iminopeptidase